jgi:WS/DGAT/MGAT family acyltransferase
VHVVDNFGDKGALVARLHHCIGDGIALVQVLLGMTDEVPDPAQDTRPKPRARDLLRQTFVAPVRPSVPSVPKLAGMAVQESWETLTHPAHAVELARQGQVLAGQWAKQGTDVVAATAKLLLTLPDRKTVFRGPCGILKRAAWSEPFPLDEVKAIGRRLGGTVNDVLLAAISGALRRYLETVGQPTDGVEINAMVPVSLRQPHEMGQLGNRFGLVILTLPVGTRDPIERLVIVKKRMSDIKHSPEALVAFAIINAMGATSSEIERLLIDFFATKATAALTNVPGPTRPLYLAGDRLTDFMFWVPAAGGVGLGISILSYAGTVMVGIMTDAGLVPDPAKIAEHFNAELREMHERLEHELPAESLETESAEEAAPVLAQTVTEAPARRST